MNYYRHYRKCAFSGRLLFDQDRPLVEPQPNGDNLYFVDADHRAAFHDSWTLKQVAERFAAWQRPVPPELGTNVDPITLEVINNALVSVVSQMAETMARTAYSPVFAEARDFTCALFDADLELVAQHRGLPAQIGSLRYCVPWAIKKVGAESLKPGDVIVHNDPQVGAPHLPEVCVIRPIFVEGRIGLYAATIAHQTDIGGVAPGSMPGDAREIFQEGLVIPPIKLFEEGRESSSVFQMILANVRSPESMYGDVSAMCGSLVIAERAMGELSRRYGWDLLFRYMSELKNYAERRFRAEIVKLPNGIYHGRAVVDDDGVMPGEHVIKLALAVRDDSIIADFRGSATQSRGPINCTYSVTCAATLNAILHILGGELLNNEGLHRAIHVIAPPGTIVNVNHPGAYNSGQTETHNLLVETFLNALIDVVPERCAAPSASTTCLVTGGAWHPSKRETYTFVTWDPNLVSIDMGGTSFDVAILEGGAFRQATEGEIEPTLPVKIAMIDIRTIGAGGGSIAWVDHGNALKVGPRSAGAVPSPACYDRGGTEPTTTDANVVLGRIPVDRFLGGKQRLREDLAATAVQGIADRFNMTKEAMAQGILDVTIANMAQEIRAAAAERGVDLRDFVLFAGGGAGPLHAPCIARELGMRQVLIPRFPGMLSTIGLLLSDLRFDSVRSFPTVLETADMGEIAKLLSDMAGEGRARIEAEGLAAQVSACLSLDMRYVRQNWEIAIEVDPARLDVETVGRAFDAEHRRLFGFAMDDQRHEVINLRCVAIGSMGKADTVLARFVPNFPAATGKPIDERLVYDEVSRETVRAAVYERDTLVAGQAIRGTAIVVEPDSTLYVPSDSLATVDAFGNLLISIGAG